jgi:gamma-glutamyltranspeptidase/glutathione hydrolase
MVTSPHHLATEAGQRVLASGGTAIEAAIATGAVLAVVYPHFCGLGGDGVWLISDAGGQVDCLMGIGQATSAIAALPTPLPLRGPSAAATAAGLVDSWGVALDHSRSHWGGRQTLADLLASAITLAASGFPLSPSQAFWLARRQGEWQAWPGFAALFDTTGLVPGRNAFRQPALARSLESLARDGARSFYDGALAERIATGLAAAGAPLTRADLAATRTRSVAPITQRFAGVDLFAPPPPTQGVTTLAIMAILDRLGIGSVAPDSAPFYHLIVEAVKVAFADRPLITGAAATDLLAPARLDAMAGRIRADAAMPWPHPFQHGDTVFIGAVDAEGRAVSLLQSLYFDWGSGVVAGDTGILWQNRAAAFNGLPGHPDRIRPGAWPFFTLNPGLALRDGIPRLVYGTQGADGQPQTLAVLLARILGHHIDPAAALAGPRFLLGRGFADDRDSLKLESDVGDAVLSALRGLGHAVAPIPPLDPLCGQAGIIAIEPEGIVGAHDPRGDGCALGV